MNAEHRCQFCDHVFPGRRRRFCYDCLPAYGDVHPKTYMAKYNLLYAVIGIGEKATSSPLPKGHPARPLPTPKQPVTSTCVECQTVCVGRRTYCSERCRRAHVRHGNRAKSPGRATVAINEPVILSFTTVSRRRRLRDMRTLVSEMSPVGECAYCKGLLRPWWSLYSSVNTQRRCYECHLATKRSTAARPKATQSLGPAVVACSICSSPFTRSKHRRWYCSDDCKKVAEREQNRAQNMRRRGAQQGEPYTLRMIVDRDGSSCHLCGKNVDLSLSGSLPKGPSIDHLVPISAGGADCFTNVALAHRICNTRRGADGPAQLRLVG